MFCVGVGVEELALYTKMQFVTITMATFRRAAAPLSKLSKHLLVTYEVNFQSVVLVLGLFS